MVLQISFKQWECHSDSCPTVDVQQQQKMCSVNVGEIRETKKKKREEAMFLISFKA